MKLSQVKHYGVDIDGARTRASPRISRTPRRPRLSARHETPWVAAAGKRRERGRNGPGGGGLIGVATLPAAFLRQQQTPICDGGKEVRQQTATSRKGGTKSAPPIPCPRPTPCSF